VEQQGLDLLREAHLRAPDDHRIAATYALAVARIVFSHSDFQAVAAEARDLAERTLARDPARPEARVALGFIHLNGAEAAAAVAQLKKALSLAPNSVDALDCLGRILVEIGRPELGIAMLRRALATDPLIVHARHAIARGYALMGDHAQAIEVLGPVPVHPGDFVPYVVIRGRFMMWFGDRTAAARLARDVAEAKGVAAPLRRGLETLLDVARSGTMDAQTFALMDLLLPVEKALSPRRAAYNAQIKTEVKLAAGATASALADLRVSDSHGLLDLLWLDRCPLLDAVRSTPEFVFVRDGTAARVDRVTSIVDR
jgi:serine/threonine-protein kinase